MKPWFTHIDSDYADKDTIKQIPGAKWDPGARKWIVPVEMVLFLKRAGLRVSSPGRSSSATDLSELPEND